MDVTVFRSIENPSGSISLWDLWNDNTNKWYKEPCLEFKGIDFWDNQIYIYNFLKSLKKDNDKNVKQELKKLCQDNNLDYKDTKKELLDIFKTSKKLKYWKRQLL